MAITFQHPVIDERKVEIAEFQQWLRAHTANHANAGGLSEYDNVIKYLGTRRIWYDVTQLLLHGGHNNRDACAQGFNKVLNGCFYVFHARGQIEKIGNAEYSFVKRQNDVFEVNFLHDRKYKHMTVGEGDILVFAVAQGYTEFLPARSAKSSSFDLNVEIDKTIAAVDRILIDSLEGIDDMTDKPFRLFSWDAYNPETGEIYGGEMLTARNDQNARDKIVASLLNDEAKAALEDDLLQLVIVQVG